MTLIILLCCILLSFWTITTFWQTLSTQTRNKILGCLLVFFPFGTERGVFLTVLRFFQTAKITKHLQHKFQAIPKGHERKSYKESEGSTKLGHERLKVVEKWLFFNQHVRGHVPEDKAEFSIGFLKKNIYILWLNLCLLTTRVNGSSLNLYSK